MPANTGATTRRTSEPRTKSITRLSMLLQPRSGTSLRLMMGMPSRSSSAALMVAYWTRSGTTLMSRHSLLTLLMSLSSLACSSRGSAM